MVKRTALEKVLARNDGWSEPWRGRVRNFVPKGRSVFVLYAVTLREHPEVVKVGRTTRWNNRRVAYANWNLSDGDAILFERTFTITEEFVDLPALEKALLGWLPYPLKHGYEWFVADFEEACREIDRFLCEARLSYV